MGTMLKRVYKNNDAKIKSLRNKTLLNRCSTDKKETAILFFSN